MDPDQQKRSVRLPCSHCFRRFDPEILESHEINCVFNPDSRAAALATTLAERKNAFMNNAMPAGPSTTVDPVRAYVLKKAQIEDQLSVLKERKSKGISIVILGSVQSGKTTIKNQLVTNNYTLLDPEIDDFSENFVKEIVIADSMMVVIDASKDLHSQETNGLLLAPCLEIKPLVCCLNKMDLSPNPEEAYKRLKQQVLHRLRLIGYDVGHIIFVPTSALTGTNIREGSNIYGWYNGSSLSQALDQRSFVSKQSKALRVVVEGVREDGLIRGRVHSGMLLSGQNVVLSPGYWSTEVEQISTYTGPVKEAFPGEIVNLKLGSYLEGREVKPGTVISSLCRDPAVEAEIFTARLMVCGSGSQLLVDANAYLGCCHKSENPMYVTELSQRVKRGTGEIVADFPESLNYLQFGIVQLLPDKPMVVEKFVDYPTLGRIMILEKSNRSVVALGIITDVEKIRQPCSEA